MTWKSSAVISVLLACLHHGISAQTSWPAPFDELEDMMFLTQGYRARNFANAVTPCSNGAGPGRFTAAEWIRTAFHDMASGNIYTGVGGLDASIIYETARSENVGSAFVTTLTTFAPFFSNSTSMSDIIALGVYTATRSCGGPVIPIRAGRIDAVGAGASGQIPVPQDGIGIFKNRFLRFGYNSTEMIQFVACGHSLGGVHSANFPTILPTSSNAPNGFQAIDTTPDVFDNKVVTEFIQGTTKNPLVVGPSVAAKQNSDAQVFSSDNNVTLQAMSSVGVFTAVCKSMFQRMIETVPSGVSLSAPLVPYELKPYALQLTLLAGGASIQFAGDIRVRMTQRTTSSIARIQVLYKDRNGADVSTPISTSQSGDASGFDDTFSFYGFSTTLPAATSISSFTVLITLSGGGTEVWNNNGVGFKVDDTVILQTPQSCFNMSGNLNVVAAVRNSASAPTLQVVMKNPQASGIVVPSLSTVSIAMATQSAVGYYQLYSAMYTLISSQTQPLAFGVFAGGSSDTNKAAAILPSTCSPLGTSIPTATTPPSAFTFQGCYLDKADPRALSGANTADDAMTVEECSTFCSGAQYFGLEYGRECYCGNSLDASSVIMGLTDCNMACGGNANETCGAGNRITCYINNNYSPPKVAQITGYNYLGCYSEGTNSRALSDASFAADNMTVEDCAVFCNGAPYFGLEYGRECYCGANINVGSVLQASTDCSMLCAGNKTEYCGSGGRLNLYQQVATSFSSTSTFMRTLNSSLSQSATAAGSSIASSFTGMAATSAFVNSSSVVSSSSLRSDSSTIPSSVAPSTSTPMISVLATVVSTATPSSSDLSSSTLPSSTASTKDLSGWVYEGCMSDSVSARTLDSKAQASDSNTYTSCAQFCTGYIYFGVEYGRECYCGDSLDNNPTLALESDCNMLCAGDGTASCGAGDRLGVWKSTTTTAAPSNPSITGYNYTGCYSDAVNARVLTGSYLFDSNMTIAMCATFCNGSEYFGTEYGGECYCGATYSNLTQQVPESDCSILCPGTNSEYCGAGDRLSMWSKVVEQAMSP